MREITKRSPGTIVAYILAAIVILLLLRVAIGILSLLVAIALILIIIRLWQGKRIL